MQFTKDATRLSFKAKISARSFLYHRRGGVLLDDPMMWIVPRPWFDWQLLDLCWVFKYNVWCSTWRADAFSIINNLTIYANLCNVALLWLRQQAGISLVMVYGCPSTKIPFQDTLFIDLWTSKLLNAKLVLQYQWRHCRWFDVASSLALSLCHYFIHGACL